MAGGKGRATGEDVPNDAPLPATDAPITSDGEDRFGRTHLADAIADELTGAASPLVVAVVGPWGSGKTSVLELVRSRLDPTKVVAIDFNPWLFAGADQLVQRFLSELVGQLSTRTDTRLRDVADRINRYSQILDPIGHLPGVGGVAKAGHGGVDLLSGIFRRKARFHGQSADALRKEIVSALAASEMRFVVLIDDLDRLEQDEVRDIVRLVRLVADFPQVNYLLAFDRERVEIALGRDDQAVGRDYLEKIVQVTYTVPMPERAALRKLAFVSLDHAIARSNTRPLDQGYWSLVWPRAIEPLIRTPRDIVRYGNAVRGAVRSLGDEVNLVDILALEAYRVLLPDVFDRLPRLAAALTTVGHVYGGGSDPQSKRKAESLAALQDTIALGGDRSSAVAALLAEVFPATAQLTGNTSYGSDFAKQWRADRRVANAEVLAFYLTHVLPPGSLPTFVVDLAVESLADAEAVNTLFGTIDDGDIGPLLDRLEDHEAQYPDDPTAALVAIANLRPRVPRGVPASWFFGDFDAEDRIDRVLYRLLRHVASEDEREDVLRRALPEVSTLSGRLWLTLQSGHRENIGQGLITPDAQATLEEELRAAIVAAPTDRLATERELSRLIWFLHESGDPKLRSVIDTLVDDDDGLAGLLESALTMTTATDNRGRVKRTRKLAWDSLEEVVGKEALVRRIADLPTHPDAGTDRAAAIELARRYSTGWRPKDFWDDDDD